VGIALVVAPAVMLGYVGGLRHGPYGVALGYSLAMVLLTVPVIAWAKRGTLITHLDVLRAMRLTFFAIAAGAAVTLAAGSFLDLLKPALFRLSAKSLILFGIYLLVLLFVMKQKAVYVNLLRETGLWPFRSRETREESF